MSRTKDGWIRCDGRRQKCPVCDGDWCTVSPDGQYVCCMRMQSGWPVKNGGWMHIIGDDAPRPKRESTPPPELAHRLREASQGIDFPGMLCTWSEHAPPPTLVAHARQLGLSTDSLLRLGMVWAGPYRAWAFPMYDVHARIVGVRLRDERGSKWAVPGSAQGLFWPDGDAHDGDWVMVCEGPTDTAAALDLGFYALGRPACRGMERELACLLTGKHVVIMADRDEPKQRPDGSRWHPGQEGAQSLAKALFGKASMVKLILPNKGKDIRQWLTAGATSEVVRLKIQHTPVWHPRSEQ